MGSMSKARRKQEVAPTLTDGNLGEVDYNSEWAEYVTRVPQSTRAAIADKVRAADLSTHAGYRALNLLLLAEVVEGHIPLGVVRAIDGFVKNAFASLCAEKAGASGGNLMTIERLILERRTEIPMLPAEELYTGASAPEPILLEAKSAG